MIYYYVTSLLAVIGCTVAAILDNKTKKIPNKLTFTMMLVGIVFNVFFNLKSIPFFLIAMIFWFLIGSLKIIGLGDIKLIMGLAAIGGYAMSGYSVLIALILFTIYVLFKYPALVIYYIKKILSKFIHRKKIVVEASNIEIPFAQFLWWGVVIYSLFVNPLSPIYAYVKILIRQVI